MVEPEEIEHLRIPSRHTMEVTQFVDEDELDPEFFEKPYFVVPENDVQAEAFAVVRKALQTTKKIALGKIAFGGREHLVAIGGAGDDRLAGHDGLYDALCGGVAGSCGVLSRRSRRSLLMRINCRWRRS